ncbi:uncharacterized protein B0I36DRAFT_343716 [Microdochium trichocladiopsis]|uniref:Transcription factor domain-containing protein n=1 Tax=Microdochium trichocladiopsis TaxID=1682393 RepID=A0A9P8YDN4_9PEZI|nr:uncharacterized protein B0I36DRAFT_343716 [Microdochium trichocladiopsis]KAH7039887.1 hypothetical protein B0I36DRAFT_343716 [Microdochium trichocladiopsis]
MSASIEPAFAAGAQGENGNSQHGKQTSHTARPNGKDRRASRCDLIPGQLPCRRCRQEQRECVLTVSRRGGRRVRRSAIPEDDENIQEGVPEEQEAPSPSVEDQHRSSIPPAHPLNEVEEQTSWPPSSGRSLNGTDSAYATGALTASPPSLPATTRTKTAANQAASRAQQVPSHTYGVQVGSKTWSQQPWDEESSRLNQRQAEQHGQQSRSSPEDNLEGHITSVDLINPSDALDLLAQVAQRSGEEDRVNDAQEPQTERRHNYHNNLDGTQQDPEKVSSLDYPPIANGEVTVAEARRLLKLKRESSSYEQKYHHFFPVAHHAIFADDVDICEVARQEPFLLSAVLTIASKNEPSASKAFVACSAHVEVLISNVIYCGSASVGAVEALLILAEWPPQRLQSKRSIGRGEEDQGAWMQVGCAIRLGYLQRLEQTGLFPGRLMESKNANRKRLAWAACYMSDRQISIRLGKGFWSRGPGPSTILHAADFPSLRPLGPAEDDLSLLFKAHLELTQLFSNAHDILYSSSMHREHLYSGGEYVRYIDDFASMLRNWKLLWGSLSCESSCLVASAQLVVRLTTLTVTPHVKATLVLSYDYLRLYIHAFAFQAEIFIDPVAGLRYMPLKYYLYIIYAAVFLFKARLAEAITSDGEEGVRRTIAVTVDRLQKSATNRQSPGYRYARLVHQLWLKPRSRESTVSGGPSGPANGPSRRLRPATRGDASSHPSSQEMLGDAQGRRNSMMHNPEDTPRRDQYNPYHSSPRGGQYGGTGARMMSTAANRDRLQPRRPSSNMRRPPSLASPNVIDFDAVMNDFSWRDLHAVGEFINNDTSTAESVLPSPDFDQRLAAADAAGGGGDGIQDTPIAGGGGARGGHDGAGALAGEAVDDWISSWMGTDVIF